MADKSASICHCSAAMNILVEDEDEDDGCSEMLRCFKNRINNSSKNCVNQISVAWSTREELLLVCAAKFHGHQCWDNIAIEVQYQSRRSEHFFTPRKCIAMFRYLHQQISGGTDAVVYDQTLDSMVEVLK